jgi:hypothetical protein
MKAALLALSVALEAFDVQGDVLAVTEGQVLKSCAPDSNGD